MSPQPSLRPLGEAFGDDTAAAAMIDRLLQHAEVISMKATAVHQGA
jgi:hypothetical protein